MYKSIALTGLLLVGLLFGCSAPKEESVEIQRLALSANINSIPDAEALDIAEAIFRYQFRNNASAIQQMSNTYFLTLFENDPAPKFLKRFEGHEPPVEKGSIFESGKGLLFKITRIKRINNTKVEVSGGYYEGNLSASGNSYFAEKKDGKWIVTENNMLWIS